ncbi:hypothetical protein GCM10009640_16630 [Agrococcus citreus]|uniref:Aromatic acid exporter family member 1 n=1 Tax=Agrococcus citreus TaxID=84643 RepID=A0ABN1YW63_9MICO
MRERDEAATTGPASVADPEVTGEGALSPMMAAVAPDAKAAAQVAKRSVARALPLFRVAIAVRAALAAMAAWLLANQLGDQLAAYAYAAPLGAFVATGTTIFTVARTALRQAIGMTVGAVIGMGILAVEWPGIAKIGLIAGVAVLMQGIPRFGQAATVVPVVALLVIIFGGVDADGYAIGYVGQFTLGMAIGVLVNAVALPPLYDRETRQQIHETVQDLAERTEVLAETLRGDWPPEREDWAGWGPELRDRVVALDAQVDEAREARRFNLRMLWHRHDLDVDVRAVSALRSVVHRMDDVLESLAAAAWDRPITIELERDERRLAADAVEALAAHLHAWHDQEGVDAASTASLDAIDALYRRSIEDAEPQSGVATVIFALRAMRERVDWAAAAAAAKPESRAE